MVTHFRRSSKVILAEKMFFESKPNVRETKDCVSVFLSTNKGVSRLSRGISKVKMKSTDLDRNSESLFGLHRNGKKRLIKYILEQEE